MENIDLFIVVGFLLLNLAVGLYFGRNVKTIKDYALGGRNFSTLTLASTLVATWVGGSSLAIKVSESYNNGLYYIITGLVDPLTFLIVAYIFVPRMSEFLGRVSIAEAMGNMYGKKVRIVCAFSGVLGTIGYVAIQFKVSAALFSYFLGINGFYATILSSIVVICYSSYRGIQAVTFTDIVQFFAFGVFIPVLTLLVWGTINDFNQVLDTISNNPIFDINEVFNYQRPDFWSWLGIMIFFLVPGFDPAVFQRISMAKNVMQVKKSLIIASILCLVIGMMMYWVGILLLSADNSLDPKQLIGYVIEHYSYSGLKGVTVVGILAMVMSTADSYINSSSILIAHDILKPLGVNVTEKKEFVLTRVTAIVLGLFAVIPALSTLSLREVIVLTFSFYMPVVTVPFMLSVFGFRSSSKSVLLGMAAGIITIVIFYFLNLAIDAVIPASIVNLIVLVSSHYALKQEGGWVGIQDEGQFEQIKKDRRDYFKNLLKNINQFNFFSFCCNNSPKHEVTYSLLGLFSIVSIYSSMFAIDVGVRNYYSDIFNLTYHSVLILSACLLTYPVWPPTIKNNKFISVIYIFSSFYILVFSSGLQVIISNFNQLQSMIFMLNLVILAILLRWQVALLFIILGSIASIEFFKWYSGLEMLDENFGSLQFKIIYLLLFLSSILIAFFKPKQEYVEHVCKENTSLTHKIDDYSDKLQLQEKEIARLGETAQRILNNVNHELRLPVGNVMNFAEMLSEGLGKYSEKQLKELSDEVLQNTNRLSSMILNMLDLATLDAKRIELDKSTTNLSRLVEERAKHCFKLYKDNRRVKFKLDIEPEILVKVDPNYVRQTVDNLVINAIRYSCQGTITVTLRKNQNQIIFTITDEGLGIPKEELLTIFEPFQQSSKTTSKAEGRGVGLALCKAAVEAHGGTISAESDGYGAMFRFVLPL